MPTKSQCENLVKKRIFACDTSSNKVTTRKIHSYSDQNLCISIANTLDIVDDKKKSIMTINPEREDQSELTFNGKVVAEEVTTSKIQNPEGQDLKIQLAPGTTLAVCDEKGDTVWKVDPSSGPTSVPKITFDGVIDPRAIQLTPQTSNPFGSGNQDALWISSVNEHLYRGAVDLETPSIEFYRGQQFGYSQVSDQTSLIMNSEQEGSLQNHYNPVTGVFTIPMDGTYTFTFDTTVVSTNQNVSDANFQMTRNTQDTVVLITRRFPQGLVGQQAIVMNYTGYFSKDDEIGYRGNAQLGTTYTYGSSLILNIIKH